MDPQEMMGKMLENITAARAANPPPAPGERQGALQQFMDAARTEGVDDRTPLQMLGAGMLSAKDPFDARGAAGSAFNALAQWNNTQRESAFKREMMATKAQYDDVVARQKEAEGGSGLMTQLAHAALNPIQNIGGVGINRLSGQTVVPKALEGVYSQVFQKAYAAATEQKMPNPETYAKQVADKVIQENILNNPSVAGSLYAQRPGQAPLPAQGGEPSVVQDTTATQPGEANFSFDVSGLAPDSREMVKRLIARYRANPNPGTQESVARAINELINGGTLKQNAPAPIQQENIAYLDQAKQAARKETETESAKTYAKLFADSVAKPAQSFADTGKIMQDFNTLGQMNYALKNGKLKEFMAGDAGKYALSFLPSDSELRKGIANAQEAEKLTAGMVNQILLAANGVQTEGDSQRARSQVTSIGSDPDANAYLEAYVNETARQLKMREQSGLAHKKATGSFEGYGDAWTSSPLMKEAKGSVKKLGTQWIGVTQYIEKFKNKNPGATDSDAVQSWNRVK